MQQINITMFDIWVYLGIGIIVFLLILITISFIFSECIPYLDEWQYIKMEIRRSEGEEHAFWKRKLKKFYVQRIPFVRHFHSKKRRKKKRF